MEQGKLLAQELTQEGATTRNVLEQIPEKDFGWSPHEKSMTMGRLAGHVAESLSWTDVLLGQDEFDMNPDVYKPMDPKNRAELLESFDAALSKASSLLEQTEDAHMARPWRFKSQGQLIFELPRAAVVRMFILSHLIHHRGQLSVYMRLRDIPVPSIYGPTADAPM